MNHLGALVICIVIIPPKHIVIEEDVEKPHVSIARNLSLIILTILKVLMKIMLTLGCGYCTLG
jgi:hypothetical protein